MHPKRSPITHVIALDTLVREGPVITDPAAQHTTALAERPIPAQEGLVMMVQEAPWIIAPEVPHITGLEARCIRGLVALRTMDPEGRRMQDRVALVIEVPAAHAMKVPAGVMGVLPFVDR